MRLLGGKESQSAILRMETPVIYFYSDTGRAVDVRVRLPKGEITEWYPQATRIGPAFRPTVRNMNLGRFLAPAQQIALGSNRDQEAWNAVYKLTERITAPATSATTASTALIQ